MSFNTTEQQILSNYFTNHDRQVFALKNLPEATKGALFARYSRSSKDLRRLFLDEFYTGQQYASDHMAGAKRAEELYNKVLLGYGDDSVAQLGGAHIAVEGVSQLCIKVMQRSRLMSFLEQSTRYVWYSADQYYKDHGLSDEASESIRKSMKVYRSLSTQLTAKYAARGHIRGARAKALDTTRGLLPAAALSNVGMYGSGQAYETLLHRMFASELHEAQDIARLILRELQEVIPSFVKRVPLADRGQKTISHLIKRNADDQEIASVITKGSIASRSPSVRLVSFDKRAEDKVLSAILYEHTELDSASIDKWLAISTPEAKAEVFKRHIGKRTNRRHKPGRAFEAAVYTFELCTSYGAFRDLQRHRMCTIQWQKLTPDLGYVMPHGLGQYVGLFRETVEAAAEAYWQQRDGLAAQYLLPMAYKIRYKITINARALCHMLELRTQPEGHAEYIDVCRYMHELIAALAHHEHIHDAMSFVDYGDEQ